MSSSEDLTSSSDPSFTVTRKTPSSTKKTPSPRVSGPPSRSRGTRRQQFPIRSQFSRAPQQIQQPKPIYPWSAHTSPHRIQYGQWKPPSGPSPFVRDDPGLSPTTTAAGELFLFGGYVHSSSSASNDLYMISTRDFSTNPLKTSGDVPNPRYGHCTAFTGTDLLILGGRVTSMTILRRKKEGHDDSLYLLNLGTSDLFMSGPAAADQNFFYFQHRESGSASWSMVPGPAVVSIIP